jgi:hypothetical protein
MMKPTLAMAMTNPAEPAPMPAIMPVESMADE